MGVDRHPHREPHTLIAQVPGQPGAGPGAVAANQDRLVTRGSGELGQGEVDQLDQVIAGTGWDVARPQQAGQGFTRGLAAVQVSQQRVEPEGVLVGPGRALLGIAVGGYQGRVGVDDQQLNVGVGTGGPRAGMGPGGAQPGLSGVLGQALQHPPGGRVEATGPNSSGWSRRAARSERQSPPSASIIARSRSTAASR
jgi:hypothetical protein